MLRLTATAAALAVAAALLPASVSAQPPVRTAVGTLECDISAGIGFIIGSRKGIACTFVPATGGPVEEYTGTITKLGVDIGVTTGGRMVWNVFADTTRRRGALAGSYGGASAEATVAAGLGANVLVGGSDRTVSLQPVSIQGQAGLNVAVGVTDLELVAVR